MAHDPGLDVLEAAKLASTGQLLLKAARRLDEVALARVRGLPGAPQIRPAHTRLFPHISHEGTRATDLAQCLGVSKQAVAPLVADLVAWGLVEQVPDPTDGRARLVRWTSQGRSEMLRGLSVLADIEGTLGERIGVEKVRLVREALLDLLQLLEE